MNWIGKIGSLIMDLVTRETEKDNKPIEPDYNALYPPFKALVDKLLFKAQEFGLNVEVHQGLRTFQQQQKLYDQGRKTPGKIVTRARPGFSFHQYGIAADIVFKKNGKWSWSEEHDWNKLGELGEEIGLTWGGRFRKNPDRPHFQLNIKFEIIDLYRSYLNGKIPRVWELLDKET
jgi:peptidoglycan L-alanyl-D-glutamate endopeptidase CwlK